MLSSEIPAAKRFGRLPRAQATRCSDSRDCYTFLSAAARLRRLMAA